MRDGDRVAIVSNNRLEWAVVAYACYTLGAILVPMYEVQHPEDWSFILRDCEARVLVAAGGEILAKAGGFLPSLPALEHVVVLDGAPAEGARVRSYGSLLDERAPAPRARPSPSATAGLLYTSGTTGRPKGVVLTHANIAGNLGALEQIVPPQEGDLTLAFLPWAHAFGQVVELHGVLSIGGSAAICSGVDRIAIELVEVRPTILFSVPHVWNRVYASFEEQLARRPPAVRRAVHAAMGVALRERAGQPVRLRDRWLRAAVDRVVFSKVRARLGGRLRQTVSGGASLSRPVAEFIEALGIEVYEGYGLTETSPVATTNYPGARKLGSVGRPIPGVRIEIHPPDGEGRATEDVAAPASASASISPRGAGSPVEGEIVVYGHNVMKGYFARPEESAAAFTRDGGLRTGDLGYLDADGYLFVTGRIKEQYKLENGKYVAPAPLEEALRRSPFVVNAMVHGENRPYNVAVVVVDVPAVRRWGAQRGLALPTEADALLGHEAVQGLFEAQLAEYGAKRREYEAVRRLLLVPGDFTVENGLLTPSMKLKRRAVVAAYRSRIEELYARPAGGDGGR